MLVLVLVLVLMVTVLVIVELELVLELVWKLAPLAEDMVVVVPKLQRRHHRLSLPLNH